MYDNLIEFHECFDSQHQILKKKCLFYPYLMVLGERVLRQFPEIAFWKTVSIDLFSTHAII